MNQWQWTDGNAWHTSGNVLITYGTNTASTVSTASTKPKSELDLLNERVGHVCRIGREALA